MKIETYRRAIRLIQKTGHRILKSLMVEWVQHVIRMEGERTPFRIIMNIIKSIKFVEREKFFHKEKTQALKNFNV